MPGTFLLHLCRMCEVRSWAWDPGKCCSGIALKPVNAYFILHTQVDAAHLMQQVACMLQLGKCC